MYIPDAQKKAYLLDKKAHLERQKAASTRRYQREQRATQNQLDRCNRRVGYVRVMQSPAGRVAKALYRIGQSPVGRFFYRRWLV